MLMRRKIGKEHEGCIDREDMIWKERQGQEGRYVGLASPLHFIDIERHPNNSTSLVCPPAGAEGKEQK
jgi:hypothetical protein